MDYYYKNPIIVWTFTEVKKHYRYGNLHGTVSDFLENNEKMMNFHGCRYKILFVLGNLLNIKQVLYMVTRLHFDY